MIEKPEGLNPWINCRYQRLSDARIKPTQIAFQGRLKQLHVLPNSIPTLPDMLCLCVIDRSCLDRWSIIGWAPF